MILHLGNDYFVKIKDIIMILDYEEAVENEETRLFLKGIPHVDLSEGSRKAIIITLENGKQKAYFSPISTRTLLKRGNTQDFLEDAVLTKEKEGRNE